LARSTGQETVVLVHGLWLSGWSLYVLGQRLARHGFETFSFSYPSVSQNLLQNAERLQRFLVDLERPVVHLVGHSLGGIVIRALFHQHPEQPPGGRIVTLGSPHGGSYPASMLVRTALGRKITGRSIQQLLAGMPAHWQPVDRDIGIIAGDLSVGMGRLFRRLPRPNDGVVSAAEAALPGATDSITLHVSHTAMVVSSQVAQQVSWFLKHGRFQTNR